MELDAFGQADALIRHWLGEPPAEENETYLRQIRQSLWLEARRADTLAQLLGVKRK